MDSGSKEPLSFFHPCDLHMLACVSKGHQEAEMCHSLMFKTEDYGGPVDLAEVLGEEFVRKIDMQHQAAGRPSKGEYEVSTL